MSVSVECQSCGKVFEAERNTRKFCSGMCRGRNWRKSIGKTIPTSVRLQVLLRDKKKCVYCGTSAEEGRLYVVRTTHGARTMEELVTVCLECVGGLRVADAKD